VLSTQVAGGAWRPGVRPARDAGEANIDIASPSSSSTKAIEYDDSWRRWRRCPRRSTSSSPMAEAPTARSRSTRSTRFDCARCS
jgi:hypothetical protein